MVRLMLELVGGTTCIPGGPPCTGDGATTMLGGRAGMPVWLGVLDVEPRKGRASRYHA